jgi:hypothetical protein
LSPIFEPLLNLKQNISARADAALSQVRSSAFETLESCESEISSFFEHFCEEIEKAGHSLLNSLGSRRKDLRTIKSKINGVTAEFQSIEEVARINAAESLKGVSPERQQVFQLLPPYTLNFESVYNQICPGTPIRDEVMRNYGGEYNSGGDLVVQLGVGEDRTRYFDETDDFFDDSGFVGEDLFYVDGEEDDSASTSNRYMTSVQDGSNKSNKSSDSGPHTQG